MALPVFQTLQLATAMQPQGPKWRIDNCYYFLVDAKQRAGKLVNNPTNTMNPQTNPSVTNCANCHSPMPTGLRFCRNCGYRLGEGSAEYTETARFTDAPGTRLSANSPGMAPAPYGFAGAPLAAARDAPKKKRRKLSGMTWLFLGLMIFFVAAAAFTAIVRPARSPAVNIQFGDRARPLSYVGVNSFDTTEGGVTFDNVEPPGSPADLAGLVGGDVITSFDGKVVTTDDEISDMMRGIPPGKTVEIIYLRDGETKTTRLTTVSRADFEQLEEIFENRPQGRAQFGYEDGDARRVPIADTKMFGVQLGKILPNRPADIAGVKYGDIVIEFDGIPIRTSEEFLSRVRRAEPYSTIKLVVMRGTERLEIPVKLGKA